MKSPSWGRFTAMGGPAVENQIHEIVREVGETARRTLSEKELLALLVIGGYGRGEGGTERWNGSGIEHPHNNIDFLVVAPDERQPLADLKRRLDEALADQERAFGVGIDFSVTSLPKLKRSPSLVIWYDIRHGHKTILGDPGVFDSMSHFSRERIPAWDVRNLLTNRGTLLVINDHVLAHTRSPDRKLLIRHAMKAVIGYGDALLYFLGEYDWSYREKQRRMAARGDVGVAFRDLYEEATSFRFFPRYEDYLGRDLTKWLKHVRDTLEPVHLECEARRLGVRSLRWDQYLPLALRRSLTDAPFSARAWARKAVHAARGLAAGRWSLVAERALAPTRLRSAAGALCTHELGLLSTLFPVIAYDGASVTTRRFAEHLLRAASSSRADLRSAYLHAWARHGDVNFGRLLARIESQPRRKGEPS